MAKPKRKFECWENEGSFFAEYYIRDNTTGHDWPHMAAPYVVLRELCQEVKDHQTLTPIEARIIVDSLIRTTTV